MEKMKKKNKETKKNRRAFLDRELIKGVREDGLETNILSFMKKDKKEDDLVKDNDKETLVIGSEIFTLAKEEIKNDGLSDVTLIIISSKGMKAVSLDDSFSSIEFLVNKFKELGVILAEAEEELYSSFIVLNSINMENRPDEHKTTRVKINRRIDEDPYNVLIQVGRAYTGSWFSSFAFYTEKDKIRWIKNDDYSEKLVERWVDECMKPSQPPTLLLDTLWKSYTVNKVVKI